MSKKNKLADLAASLDNTLKAGTAKKSDSTAKILSQYEPLPKVITQSETQAEVRPISDHRDQSTDQIDQISDQSDTGIKSRPVQASTVSESRPVQNLDRSNEKRGGYTRLPNEILDTVLPRLSPTEAIVFLRLYRLSAGFNQNTCLVGISSLIEACNISEQTCRTALRRLIDLNHIKQVEVLNTKEIKGTVYEILTGLNSIPVQNLDRSNSDTGLKLRPNKDIDDDDFKRHDHHQSAHARETMTLYQSITGNSWSKSDQTAYEKIKHLPSSMIEQGIRVATSRAASRPGSLAYFVKEILAIANPAPASLAQRRRELQAIVQRVRTAHTGQTGYSIADFSADVKEACAREGVAFDHKLFNELIARIDCSD